jgi:hypothetical protein
MNETFVTGKVKKQFSNLLQKTADESFTGACARLQREADGRPPHDEQIDSTYSERSIARDPPVSEFAHVRASRGPRTSEAIRCNFSPAITPIPTPTYDLALRPLPEERSCHHVSK